MGNAQATETDYVSSDEVPDQLDQGPAVKQFSTKDGTVFELQIEGISENKLLALSSHLTCLDIDADRPEGPDCVSCSPTQQLQSDWEQYAEDALERMRTSLDKRATGATAFFEFKCKRSTAGTKGELALRTLACRDVIVGVEKQDDGTVSYTLIAPVTDLMLQAAYLVANDLPVQTGYIDSVDWNTITVAVDGDPDDAKSFGKLVSEVKTMRILCKRRDELLIGQLVKNLYQKGYYMSPIHISPSERASLPEEYTAWGASRGVEEKEFMGELAPLGIRADVRGISAQASEEEALRNPEEAEEERMEVLAEEGPERTYVPLEARD